jgi:putative tricarboxylic transport membrane protein
MDAFLAAMSHIASVEALILVSAGCVLALILGILPGLSSTEALVILLPFTFVLGLNDSMVLLSAAYASAFVGGALTSIVFGIPGTSTGLATVLDGHPLHLQGRTIYAVSVAATASALAGLLSLLLVVALLPVIEPLSLLFGPAEWFAFVVLGLVVLAFSTEDAFLRGLISAGLGLLLSTIGLGVITGFPRYTFGFTQLWGGIPIVAAFVGLYPLAEAFDMALGRSGGAPNRDQPRDQTANRRSLPSRHQGQLWEGFVDTITHSSKWVFGGLIGWLVGVIPGVGATLANTLGYLLVRETTRDKSKFGKGDVRGLIGSESANNGSVGGALVPALALGIPGSLNTAILLGVFMINGVQPGTNVFAENLDVTWIILISVALATLMSSGIVIGGGWRLVLIVTSLQPRMIAPVIMFIGFVAVLLARGNPIDLFFAGGLGVLGLAMKRYGFSRISFVIALMLGSLVESAFFQSLAIGRGSYAIFVQSTTSILIWLAIGACLVLHVRRIRTGRRHGDGRAAR